MSAELQQTGVFGAPRKIRTCTDRDLNPVPLPLGYWRETILSTGLFVDIFLCVAVCFLRAI